MESPADVHELLSQYAEEIRSSVSQPSQSLPIPSQVTHAVAPDKGCTFTRRCRRKTVRRTEFL